MSALLSIAAVIVPIAHAAGTVCALHALMHVRTAQGTIAWVMCLITFPYVAIPAYGVFGRSKFEGYVAARRAGNRRLAKLETRVANALQPHAVEPESCGHAVFRPLIWMTGLPLTRGNGLRLLVDGDETFASLLAALRDARAYILMQFFIVHSDHIGEQIKDILTAKAKNGVQIYFLYDAYGSRGLAHRYVEELVAAGVSVCSFRSTRGWKSRFQINFRNHRKITVTDGRMGFVGGLNIGDEYLGRSRRFGAWRDTHLKVEGPAVQCIQWAFLADWNWATGEIPDLEWTPASADGTDQKVFVLPTGPADRLEPCQLFLVAMIHAARTRLWLTSPYFVPDGALVAALQLAALRGVDVRIMLPERPDHLLVYLCAYSFYDGMMDAGVKMYRYGAGFMHQKVILVDDRFSSVGTVNLDNRSLFLNFEITAVCSGAAFAADVETMLMRDFSACREVQANDYRDRPWLFKAAVRAARLLSPIQ